MKEKKLIELVALIWFENGGDSEGIGWCWQKIKEEVARLEAQGKRG